MRTVLLFTCVLLTPLLSLAHATGGTFETTVDEYLIDIGFVPETPVTTAVTRFDFLLTSATSTEPIPYSDVWVRIERDEQLYFSGSITNPRIGPTGLTILLDTPGQYTVTARYLSDLTTLTETHFSLTVVNPTAAPPYWWIVPLFLLTLLGAHTIRQRRR
jgi:hypothetical protein